VRRRAVVVMMPRVHVRGSQMRGKSLIRRLAVDQATAANRHADRKLGHGLASTCHSRNHNVEYTFSRAGLRDSKQHA
jgi:hypothetical protein